MVGLSLPQLVVLRPNAIREKPDFFHPAGLIESSNMFFHVKVSFKEEQVLLLLSKKTLIFSISFLKSFFLGFQLFRTPQTLLQLGEAAEYLLMPMGAALDQPCILSTCLQFFRFLWPRMLHYSAHLNSVSIESKYMSLFKIKNKTDFPHLTILRQCQG